MDEIKLFIRNNDLSNHPGGEKLLNRHKFLELLKLCESKNIGLGGFDGFHLREGGVQIDMEFSLDNSGLSKEEGLERACAFIQMHPADIAYEVVLKE